MIVDFDWHPSESSHFSHPVIKVSFDTYVMDTQRPSEEMHFSINFPDQNQKRI